jgi:hypothetical protein
MANYTKGPWRVTDGFYPGFLEVVGASFKISIVTSATDISINQAMTREADAHLISAAPELLEALQELASAAEAMGIDTELARAAIEKATRQ